MEDTTKAQVEIAKRLQMKMLKRWEDLLDSGQLSATDAATLTRFLLENGWNVDPAKLPQSLKDVLTTKVDPSQLAEDSTLYPFGGYN